MSDKRINHADYPYRPCVGIALFNSDGKVFVGERIDTPGAWQMPQGGIDEGESIELAALRELSEEIGTNKATVIKVSPQKIFYDLPLEIIEDVWKTWGAQYRGQEQTWVAMRFTGHDDDINLNAHMPPEFKNWQWVGLKDTIELIVPFKRKTYEQVIGFFSNIKI